MKTIKLATRGSKLALVQSNLVKALLEARGHCVDIVTVSTRGDRDQKSPLTKIGGNGLFVREVETYLLDGRADIAVHSGKDLPYELASGLLIGGTPAAADPRDCLLSRRGTKPGAGAVIGSSSPRRTLECRRFYPDAEYQSIRGNVDTRLWKLRDGQYDGIILAKAGLDRLQADLSDLDVRTFDVEDFLPAPCQGILAIECRERDPEMRRILKSMTDQTAWRRFLAEREMLSLLQADCSAALGAHCALQGKQAAITGLFQGRKATRTGLWSDYPVLCREILDEII
ncbi:MAG: hydroxymethylbilane synthase [Oscillospiraceae bacterium]|nr:hydroxymethylbilane synthase [Oscillospiraceae bacterium]